MNATRYQAMSGEEPFGPERYFFREIHPSIRIGTASDRYKGWIGQIYTESLYAGRLTKRTNRVGGGSFKDEVLPVDCVAEYFRHFRVLEIDYTFYSPLLEEDGRPTSASKILHEYARFLGPEDGLILKAPQVLFARKIRRGAEFAKNERYLDSRYFIRQFYAPAVAILGSSLKGFIFEQEYQKAGERIPAAELAASLDAFFGAVPADVPRHVELRTEAYLDPSVFDVLEKHGAEQVLSHWTWLPNLKKQYAKAGGRFIGAAGQSVIRLMTPLGVRYEDAYAKAFPFGRLVEGMLQPSMIRQTAELMHEAIRQDVAVNVIINNRAGGNAPEIARLLAAELREIRKAAG
jgi:uncharacterized protein YecE (DUF72 family)